jgi:hypothetical protein
VDVIYSLLSAFLTLLFLWFWKPWAGAYSGEKGKNLARKEDLDKILAEVRAVTLETEAIKAEIQTALTDRERHMKWRIEAYMEAVDAATRLNNLFGRLPNLMVPDRDIFETFPGDIGKLAKIHLIANDRTIAAVGAYQQTFNLVLIELVMARALLLLQIEHGTLDGAELANLKFTFLKRCLDAGFDTAQLTISAIVAIREEMEIPLDVGRYTRDSDEMLAHLRESTKVALQPFEKLLSDTSAVERFLAKPACHEQPVAKGE